MGKKSEKYFWASCRFIRLQLISLAIKISCLCVCNSSTKSLCLWSLIVLGAFCLHTIFCSFLLFFLLYFHYRPPFFLVFSWSIFSLAGLIYWSFFKLFRHTPFFTSQTLYLHFDEGLNERPKCVFFLLLFNGVKLNKVFQYFVIQICLLFYDYADAVTVVLYNMFKNFSLLPEVTAKEVSVIWYIHKYSFC